MPLVEWRSCTKTVSEANAHTHWRARHRRAKAQRLEAHLRTMGNHPRSIQWVRQWLEGGGHLHVHLTRSAPSNGLDSDNLAGSQKHIRDGVADAIGIDDRDPRVVWTYGQTRGPYGVSCTIEAAS